MTNPALRRLLLPTLIAAAFACGSNDVTTPTADEAAIEPIELSVEAMDRGDAAPAVNDRTIPTLQRLLHEAVARVRSDRGDLAARRLLEPLRTLLREAREAREAGDLATARRKLQEANLAAARIIVRVFGPQVAERLNAQVTTGLAALRERIAEVEAGGGDATRLTRAANTVQSLQRTAVRLIAEGAHPRAVLVLAHAVDLIRAVAARS